MSKENIDEWLDDVEFENFRLSLKPTAFHLSLLQREVQRMESMPVTGEEVSGNLERTISRLDCLKQDLKSFQILSEVFSRLKNLRDRVADTGFSSFRPEEALEIYDDLHSWLQEAKYEQRLRQHVNLGYFRHFWPMADQARRREMVGLFATYGKERFTWGSLNFRLSAPLKVVRWLGRIYKKRL